MTMTTFHAIYKSHFDSVSDHLIDAEESAILEAKAKNDNKKI